MLLAELLISTSSARIEIKKEIEKYNCTDSGSETSIIFLLKILSVVHLWYFLPYHLLRPVTLYVTQNHPSVEAAISCAIRISRISIILRDCDKTKHFDFIVKAVKWYKTPSSQDVPYGYCSIR